MKRAISLTALGLLVPLPTLLAGSDDPVAPAAHGFLSQPAIVLSFSNPTSVPGVGTVRGEDLVTYDPNLSLWAVLFDGSDVGIGAANVDAVHVESNAAVVTAIYLSLANPTFDIPGLIGGPAGMTVTENDVVRFTPTSLGASTAGSFEFYLDGSDIGLVGNDGDIDGLSIYPTGELAISTKGHISTPTLAAMADEDATLFTPTSTGAMTAGAFSRHFDGSDVGFCCQWQEDLDGLHFQGTDPTTAPGSMLYSTTGHWNAIGSQGNDEDIGVFVGLNYGPLTTGLSFKVIDLTQLGIQKNEDVDALSVLL